MYEEHLQSQTVLYIGIANGTTFDLFERVRLAHLRFHFSLIFSRPLRTNHIQCLMIRSVYVAVAGVCASQSSLMRSAPFSPICNSNQNKLFLSKRMFYFWS